MFRTWNCWGNSELAQWPALLPGAGKFAVPKQMLPDIDHPTRNTSIFRPSDSLGTLSVCRGSFLCLHTLFPAKSANHRLAGKRKPLAPPYLSVFLVISSLLHTEDACKLVFQEAEQKQGRSHAHSRVKLWIHIRSD